MYISNYICIFKTHIGRLRVFMSMCSMFGRPQVAFSLEVQGEAELRRGCASLEAEGRAEVGEARLLGSKTATSVHFLQGNP